MRNKTAADVASVMARPGVMECICTFGNALSALSPSAFNELIVRESAEWRPVINSVDQRLY
jgi:tripartite-type tricarboxylate transporter receptor subunit TctC